MWALFCDALLFLPSHNNSFEIRILDSVLDVEMYTLIYIYIYIYIYMYIYIFFQIASTELGRWINDDILSFIKAWLGFYFSVSYTCQFGSGSELKWTIQQSTTLYHAIVFALISAHDIQMVFLGNGGNITKCDLKLIRPGKPLNYFIRKIWFSLISLSANAWMLLHKTEGMKYCEFSRYEP